MLLSERQTARDLSLRRRFERKTADDVVKSDRSKKLLLVLAVKLRRAGKETERRRIRKIMKVVFLRYVRLNYYVRQGLDLCPRRDRTIDSFESADCPLFFRFTKEHLYELYDLLGFKEVDETEGTFTFDNKETMRGEEILLRGLYELASGESQHTISTNVFGRDQTSQSRAIGKFIHFVHEKHIHLLENNLKWWYDNGFFARSAEAIGDKLDMEGEMRNMVSHFIDCNCLETDRVGGGPAEGGANAARWDPLIQRAFYNGWKSFNGLKHQTVDDAYGFTISICGPTSLRRNDLTLLRESDINDSFARLQLASEDDFVIFGDSAYKKQTHVRSYFAAEEDVLDYVEWNKQMKRLRISIEWNYGRQASLFKYLTTRTKLRLLSSTNVSRVFAVTTLLRNLHAGFYGCQSSQYFSLPIPPCFNYCYMHQEAIQCDLA